MNVYSPILVTCQQVLANPSLPSAERLTDFNLEKNGNFVLTRAPLGYSAEHAPLGGGQILHPCLTPERMVGRRKKRQTKALNKTNLKNTKKLLK